MSTPRSAHRDIADEIGRGPLARGAACTVDFSHRFDFFAHAAERVAALRERWRVPPLLAPAAVGPSRPSFDVLHG